MSEWGLKPCPFCGSHDVVLEDITDEHGELWMVMCNWCGISVSCPGGEDGCCDPTAEECVKAWNRREEAEARKKLQVHNIGNVDIPDGVTKAQFHAVMNNVVDALMHTDNGESWPYEEGAEKQGESDPGAGMLLQNGECRRCPYGNGRSEPLECTPKLAGDALALLKEQKPGWTSVKDRLPDAAGYECLVCAINENYNQMHVFTAHTGYGEPGWWTSNVHYMSKVTSPSDNRLHPALKVTHWMRMPEPPKEGLDAAD